MSHFTRRALGDAVKGRHGDLFLWESRFRRFFGAHHSLLCHLTASTAKKDFEYRTRNVEFRSGRMDILVRLRAFKFQDGQECPSYHFRYSRFLVRNATFAWKDERRRK